jgi:acetyl esterase/lipase
MSPASRTVVEGAAPPPSYTVRYGGGPDHVADVWVRSPEGPGPIVLALHGGFWRHQWDRVHLGPMAAGLAGLDGHSASSRAGAGYVVATPEYRRTGGTAVDGRLILSGHSAGGQLALWARKLVPKAGVVALAPVADLRAAYRLDLDRGAVAALLGGSPEQVPERYAETDPLVRIPADGPVVVVHGARDAHVPPDFSVRYAEAARAAGVDARLHLPDADHFEVIDPQCPVWSVVLDAFAAVRGTLAEELGAVAEVDHVDDDPLSR